MAKARGCSRKTESWRFPLLDLSKRFSCHSLPPFHDPPHPTLQSCLTEGTIICRLAPGVVIAHTVASPLTFRRSPSFISSSQTKEPISPIQGSSYTISSPSAADHSKPHDSNRFRMASSSSSSAARGQSHLSSASPHLQRPVTTASALASAVSSGSSPSPAAPIEPSDQRQQAYTLSQNLGGRRGSTDPLLHASWLANSGLGGVGAAARRGSIDASGGAGGASSSSPYPRKRNAADASLDYHHHEAAIASHLASPGGHRYASSPQQGGGNGRNVAGGEPPLPPLTGDGEFTHLKMKPLQIALADVPSTPSSRPPADGRRPSLSALSGYSFGNWDASNPFAAGTAPSAGPSAPAQGPSTTSHPANLFATHQPYGTPGMTHPSMSPNSGNSQQAKAQQQQQQYGGAPSRASLSHEGPPVRPVGSTSHLSAPDNGLLKSEDGEKSSLPYARSPELRVSHKLAERKRRKEMKNLFDDLQDLLPEGSGSNGSQEPSASPSSKGTSTATPAAASGGNSGKMSKWEVLSKAIEHIQHLQSVQGTLVEEIRGLRNRFGVVDPPSIVDNLAMMNNGSRNGNGRNQ